MERTGRFRTDIDAADIDAVDIDAVDRPADTPNKARSTNLDRRAGCRRASSRSFLTRLLARSGVGLARATVRPCGDISDGSEMLRYRCSAWVE